jgi:hypothetical protein
MIALAATQADQVPWLLQTYERAIKAAKQYSHLKALILKYALIKLHKNWLYDYGRAEALMEEIGAYLALLYRLNGQVKNAASTLRPFIHHCISIALVLGIDGKNTRAIWALGESLLALNHVKDARDLLHYVYDTRGGSCSSCKNFFPGRENTAICQHCFEYFCRYCL